VVSFTPRPLYPQGKSPWYPLDRRLGGPQSRSGRDGEEKNSQPPPIICWGIDLFEVGCAASPDDGVGLSSNSVTLDPDASIRQLSFVSFARRPSTVLG
jgi:hypothetical protein